VEQAKTLAAQMREAGLRVSVDESSESVGKKIRASEVAKIPYAIVIGDKDIEAGTISVRAHGGTDLGALKLEDFVARATDEVARKA
jgi:threonyl-tRNA synthetase